jgi:hypothetical protein
MVLFMSKKWTAGDLLLLRLLLEKRKPIVAVVLQLAVSGTQITAERIPFRSMA